VLMCCVETQNELEASVSRCQQLEADKLQLVMFLVRCLCHTADV